MKVRKREPRRSKPEGGLVMRNERGLSRRDLLRHAGGALALGAAGSLAAVCGKTAEAADQPVIGGVLKVAYIGDPPTVDVHQTTAIVTEAVTQEVYESLFALDATWAPQPLLARGYGWSNGNLLLTMPLRTDVT